MIILCFYFEGYISNHMGFFLLNLYYMLCTSMSQSEEQQGRRPPSQGEVKVEEQQEMEEDTPLIALAPDASLPEEQPPVSIDVCANPAFQCLDEVRLIAFNCLVAKQNCNIFYGDSFGIVV